MDIVDGLIIAIGILDATAHEVNMELNSFGGSLTDHVGGVLEMFKGKLTMIGIPGSGTSTPAELIGFATPSARDILWGWGQLDWLLGVGTRGVEVGKDVLLFGDVLIATQELA
jgi:hypothetical protein